MTITLPTFARQTGFEMVRMSASRVARGPSGAGVPLNRTGDHWAMEIDPKALGTDCGREMIADIVQGSGERIRALVPQLGIDTGTPGTPKVKGASQIGSSLLIDGLTVGYVIAKGRFLTVEHATRPSLHIVKAAVTADGSGEATVTFWPPLRASPADNCDVELAAPYIEGFIDGAGRHGLGGGLAALTVEAFVLEED